MEALRDGASLHKGMTRHAKSSCHCQGQREVIVFALSDANTSINLQAPKLRHFQNEIEGCQMNGVGFPDFQKQIWTKQRIGSILGLIRKIELGAKTWPMCRLQADMVMPGSPRVQTRHDRFQGVAAIGIGELMSPAAKRFQIILAVRIRMPEIEKSSADRPALTIENKTRHPGWNTPQTRFAEVSPQGRVWSEKRARRLLGC